MERIPRRSHHRPDPTTDPAVMAFWSRIDAVLRRRGRAVAGRDADDVTQRVAVQFFSDPWPIMSAYTPERFAHVALRSRADDHRRSERIQRGEGARLRIDPATGLARAAREVSALESVDPDADHLGIDTDIEFRIACRDELREAMRLLDPPIATVLWLVAVEGWSVTDAAEQVGLSRPYVSRRLSAARRALAEVITAA